MIGQDLLDKINFIEDYTEYILLCDRPITKDEIKAFIKEHLDEAETNYQLELCGYVDVEY